MRLVEQQVVGEDAGQHGFRHGDGADADMKGKAGARAIRLGLEYYPKPPVWFPSPWLLPTGVRNAAAKKAEAFMAKRMERRKGG